MTSPASSRATLYALAAVTAIVALGTAYSVANNTYLDTSNPLLANLPHPRHAKSYFARKSNLFNQIFVKRAWGWTTLAFVAQIAQSRRRIPQRVWRWVLATLMWASFAVWFFGPALRARVLSGSGAQCVLHIPPPSPLSSSTALTEPRVLVLPPEYCSRKTTISAAEHAHLFAQTLGTGSVPAPEWRGRPKLARGHDTSGHVFLLSMSILFLIDDLATYPAPPIAAPLIALWFWMLLMTSVYFHAPLEKLSGLVVGIAGYFVTRLPYPLVRVVGTPATETRKKED